MDGVAMKITVCQIVMSRRNLNSNRKGFAIFELIITWGLISGVLVALATMQMLSVSSSLDGLKQTQHVLNLASHQECLQDKEQNTIELTMAEYINYCEKALNQARANEDYGHDHVSYDKRDNKADHRAEHEQHTAQEKYQESAYTHHTEFGQHDLLISYVWNNSRQHQQTTSVAIDL